MFPTVFRRIVISVTLLATGLLCTAVHAADDVKVLVFSKTKGFRHDSIETGTQAVKEIGKEAGWAVDATEDAALFNDDTLRKYRTVVWLNTTGDVLDEGQQAAFERFIKAGGGYLGIHSASDTEYDWEWYGKLVGAYFSGHPAQQKAKLTVVDKTNAATAHLPAVWERFDEWYNFRKAPEGVTVLLTIDEKSYQPGGQAMGDNHPMAWYHDVEGGGRAFYTELGHTKESYADPLYQKHLLGGIEYAAGMLEKSKGKKKK